ncbi:MAG: translational GTPase TypA [Elusimicrobia bacterium]|nr:translational GTPase TypA [Elusimicrobiota bacterium]
MQEQKNIRNVAIIAHVDHGKTTLIDAILRQTQTHRNINEMGERIMDSMDLERERGITIRAKNASVIYKGTKINIVDTPGHADFGGEVERILQMVDGALLLVDAKDGPMPQTRFVLRKALELKHKIIVVINKVDRPESQVEEVVNQTFDLFCELNASEEQLDFSIVYASALNGTATLDLKKPSSIISPLLDVILEKIPAPKVDINGPLQMLVLALRPDPYKGTLGVGKIISGSVKKGESALLCKKDGSQLNSKVMSILTYEGLDCIERESAEAGEIAAIAGFKGIGIGDTLTDPINPKIIPPPTIDEPTVRMSFEVNTSTFAGQEGKYVTSRTLRERLFKELETNVSLRVEETQSPDSYLVAGRGELHLAILIETMRREGYELQVSKPEVILHEKDGIQHEPFEFLVIDIPAEYQGAVLEELGKRKATLKNMLQSPSGELHFEYQIPTRSLIGLKGVLLTKTRGTIIMHHVFEDYKPMIKEEIMPEDHGSLVSMETGTSSSYALNMIQERGDLFIGPGIEVYQGMVVGENARGEDLNVNPCKEKKLTNMRASGTDDAIILTPPRDLSLELALEYIGSDELVEVTPKSIRLRKRILDPNLRKRSKKQTAS